MRFTMDTLAELMFPCQCSCCDKWGNQWLCAACRDQVTLFPFSESHDLRSFSGLRALTEYSGAVKEVLHKAKYEDQPWRLVRFTSAVVNRIRDAAWMEGTDVVIPMPGDPWRTWKRGYNPARLIACEISKVANLPLLQTRAFTRLGGKSQQSLSMTDRSNRYADTVFNVNVGHRNAQMYRKCLLVDDIGTTGATMRAAADALVAAGFDVEALVLSIGV